MSLVFLKNDDNSRDSSTPAVPDTHLLPYRWSNYFTNPIRLPRNAQVGYVKSSFQQARTGFIDDEIIYTLTGTPLLNPTIPLFVEGGVVSNWRLVFNNMSRLCNQYQFDGNFTAQSKTTGIYEGVSQEINQYGWDWFITSGNKSQIRLEQRDIEDVANQGWNSGGYNGIAGISTLGLDHIDYDIVTVDSPYYANSGFGGVGFGPSQRVNINPGVVNPVATGFTNFYDCGWTGVQVISPQGTGGGNPINTFLFNQQITGPNKGQYGMVTSNTGIKQYTSQITPIAGGFVPGHTFNGNGYAIKTFRNLPSGFALADYPNPNGIPANRGTWCGISESFGIQSIPLMENMPGSTNVTNSRRRYVERMDLNSSSSAIVAEGAVARFLIGCDIEVRPGANPGEQYPVMVVRVLDPSSLPGESSYIDVKTLDLTADAVANGFACNCANPQPSGLNPSNFAVRFRWTSPYCMAVEYTYGYRQETDEPFAPGNVTSNPANEWKLLYDMNNNPSVQAQILIPGYFGDLTLVEYPTSNMSAGTLRKGFFDYRKSYRLDQNQYLDKDLNMLPLTSTSYYEGRSLDELGTLCINTSGVPPVPTPRLEGLTPEGFDSQGLSEKEVKIVMNPVKTTAGLSENRTIFGDEYFFINSPDTIIGDILGYETAPTLLNNNIVGPPAVPYVLYGLNGGHSIHLSERVNSLHIQLTNLDIQSQNGVRSTQNKTIAVVATQDAYIQNDPINSNNIYNDTAPVINWIDLNNFNEVELNKIDVMITYDDNTEATSLENRSDVTIMFRQKPNTTGNANYVPNNIQNL